MTFNKIKSLINSVEDIEKAISSSDKLKLSEDRTKVCRVGKIADNRNVDDCTIYVVSKYTILVCQIILIWFECWVQEALPTTATHESVRKIFEAYGPVAYVSLPKFRTSQQIKEFAFVEFENRSSVLKAINAFKDFGGILNMESDPERLISVTSYLKEQQENGNVEESTAQLQIAGDPINDNNNEDEDDDKEEATSNIDEQSESASVTVSESVADLADLSDADSVTFGGLAKRAKYDGVEDDEDDDVNTAKMTTTSKGSGDENTRKKVRRKKTTAKHHKAIAEEQSKNSINTLRITTKLEWKRLRNKYLNHQREQIKELKKQLWADRKPARPVQPPPLKEKKIIKNPRNINFYGAIKESKEEEDITEVAPINVLLEKKPLFSYEPGIIVKVHFDEPCVDVKDFKMDMRQHQFVKYIDVKEGDLAAFVRVDSARSAPTLIKHCAPHKCQILTGANEESYWEKINVDRQQKLTKSLKIKPKRGREKINKMLASHVRFDD